MQYLDTDVLVIGGGLAGLSAAISARECGAETILVCKSRAGHSGNTVVSGAGISVWLPENEQGDSRDLYEADLIHSGAGINDRAMVRRVLSHSDSVLPFLEENGVSFRYLNSKKMVKKPGGHSAARYYSVDFRGLPLQTRGLSLAAMETAAQKAGVRIMDRTAVLQLVKHDGAATGCLCCTLGGEDRFCIQAGSVILAAGGGAAVFARTNNTADVSCDSYRLALEAGARLRDMEFVQFYPCVHFGRVRLQITSALFGEGAVLRNAEGEAFMQRYSPDGDHATRDVMARAVWSEIIARNGDPGHVFADCSGVDRETLESRFGELSTALERIGIDIRKDMIPVEPAAHFSMGGVCVDENWSTVIPGLYACGEAVGGLHGANRLPGAALMEAVVSGREAGRSAAVRAKQERTRCRIALPEETVMHRSAELPEWRQLIRGLREEAWKEAGIIRSERSLKRLEDYLSAQEGFVRKARFYEGKDRFAAEFLSYYCTASMLAGSAMARQESRGAHFREDHPGKDEAFSGNFFCFLDEDRQLKLDFLQA